MNLFVGIILTLACVVIFYQRKANVIYKADWLKVLDTKALVMRELRKHFDSSPSILLYTLTQICVKHHMDSGVNVILKPRSETYQIIFARGKAEDSFTLTKSVVN